MKPSSSQQADLSAFDRYAEYTDIEDLKTFSTRPLRKCVRFNTLKSSKEAFTSWAKEKQWKLEPVPWCPEGYYIERENKDEALGKDLLHLLGHMYLQEAASMLPIALLDPQPGEKILDMSAAPGSKTTQIASAMGQEGIIIANDMDEKRLRTLQDALSRSGVLNVIMTKKKGQWFGRHMTGRFDRVLIDAPCTAQGTLRKDPTALQYTSEHSIGKAAKLQRELIESAIHATKIGGRIVYSTCTLAPEENEEIVAWALEKFKGNIEPESLKSWKELKQGIADATAVQDTGGNCVRLWPQTYDTEGFFCAVFKKTGPTTELEPVNFVRFREELINKRATSELREFIQKNHGSKCIGDTDVIYDRGDQLILTTAAVSKYKLPTVDYSVGMPLGRTVRDCPLYLSHEMATLRCDDATGHVSDIDDVQLQQYLEGSNIDCPEDLIGHSLVRYRGVCIGRGRAREGKLKNHLPRWVVSHSAPL
ncbi:MAG: NOL1/NOP2/sun family putative RNA methylase [bacterium]|nr:NOL1/NOP2/sun family putative RNA methylase [bacterium]